MNECSKSYNRGYYAGSRGWYPKFAPPLPPEQVVADLIVALQNVCNAVDNQLATLDPDDEWAESLGSPMDAGFDALESYKNWIRNPS